MAGLTLALAQTNLDLWLAADAALASSQSYKIGDRELRRTDAGEVTRKIEYWSQKVALLSNAAAGRGRARTIRVA